MIHVPAQARQPTLFGLCPVTAAVEELAQATAQDRGAVFTRREVVDFLLDLTGYTSAQPLHKLRLLEPSFGDGHFLLPVIERLLTSCPGRSAELRDAIRGVELHQATFAHTRERVIELLKAHAADPALADQWLIQGDFLLTPLPSGFHVVVGNPPYVRQELIPEALLAEYRSRYQTMYDRADLYIPFIERSLKLLAPGGQAGFICADRWMKNRYGGPLRRLVADGFHLKFFVDMVGAEAFHSDVTAYPAITVIARTQGGVTRVALRPVMEKEALAELARELRAARPSTAVREVSGVAAGDQPWLLESGGAVGLLRRLEQTFPLLEETGCKVGIGVATGADEAFIGDFDALEVEADRKLPLAMTRDITQGFVDWRGLGVINPFSDEGGLVDLAAYPKLGRYLEARKEQIGGRHVARKNPANWYRTIDRITPALARTPKLLIPDIKGEAHVVYEEGRLYPHHNLYYVVSETWDLRALQAVLLSDVTRLFVAAYSTKMRGGYLRFQAQYLRRIRLPFWDQVPADLRAQLIDAATGRDLAGCNAAAYRLYALTETDQAVLGPGG